MSTSSTDGKGPLDLIRFEICTNLLISRDEWVNHRVEAWHNEEKIGHLTIAFIPRNIFNTELNNVVKFAKKIAGYSTITKDSLKNLQERYKKFEVFHVITAHVAYVYVKKTYQRQGIASALYLKGAAFIGEHESLMLAESDLQQPEIKPLWQKFVANPEIPTYQLPDGRWALDFRRTT